MGLLRRIISRSVDELGCFGVSVMQLKFIELDYRKVLFLLRNTKKSGRAKNASFSCQATEQKTRENVTAIR